MAEQNGTSPQRDSYMRGSVTSNNDIINNFSSGGNIIKMQGTEMIEEEH